MDGWQIIADERGLFNARDARAAGLVCRDLAHLTGTEQVVRLCRGWYTLLPQPLPEDEDRRRRQLHGLVARAMIREFAGRALASHHSALVLASLPIFAADLRQVHVTRARDELSRKRRGLSVHEQVSGARSEAGVIEPAVAIVQTVSSTARWPDSSLPTRPFIGRSSRRRTFPERLLDVEPVVVEFDGFVKYGRTVVRPGEPAPGDVVFTEKVREDRLRTLGYEVVRIIWSDLADLPAVRRRIEAAIQRARGRRAA
jgi:hypothetical protein